MQDKILVVGGYGDVGGRICHLLMNEFKEKVIAAGRNLDKAEKFSHDTRGKVLARRIDVSDFTSHDVLNDVQLVIVALDLPDVGFAKLCLSLGISYIDISATYKQISAIAELDDVAKENNVTGIVSVGLDPGISNLLAKYCTQQLDKTDKLYVNILLGLGEDHGEASIEWILNNLQHDFALKINGKREEVKSFQDKRKVAFPENLGEHNTYAFNFSDQYVIAKNLDIPEVKTRMAFESRRVTDLFYWLSIVGFFKLLKYKWLRKLYKAILVKLKMGTDMYALKIEAFGAKLGEPVSVHAAVSGKSEAQATASVAAKVAEQLLKDPLLAKGVFHIESLFEPKLFINGLKEMRFYSTASESSSVVSKDA